VILSWLQKEKLQLNVDQQENLPQRKQLQREKLVEKLQQRKQLQRERQQRKPLQREKQLQRERQQRKPLQREKQQKDDNLVKKINNRHEMTVCFPFSNLILKKLTKHLPWWL